MENTSPNTDQGSYTFKRPEPGPFIDQIQEEWVSLQFIQDDRELRPKEHYLMRLTGALYSENGSPHYDDLEDFKNILEAVEILREAVQKNINQLDRNEQSPI